MSESYSISTPERLLMRLGHAIRSKQKITFLFGSGVTCPRSPNGERGIPSAVAMVERVRKLFSAADEIEAFDDVLRKAPSGKKYQAAMQFMIECRGQSELNKLIRDAVLEARLIGNTHDKNDDDLERVLQILGISVE